MNVNTLKSFIKELGEVEFGSDKLAISEGVDELVLRMPPTYLDQPVSEDWLSKNISCNRFDANEARVVIGLLDLVFSKCNSDILTTYGSSSSNVKGVSIQDGEVKAVLMWNKENLSILSDGSKLHYLLEIVLSDTWEQVCDMASYQTSFEFLSSQPNGTVEIAVGDVDLEFHLNNDGSISSNWIDTEWDSSTPYTPHFDFMYLYVAASLNSAPIAESAEVSTATSTPLVSSDIKDVVVCEDKILKYFQDNQLLMSRSAMHEFIRMLRATGANITDENITMVANKLIK